ncbi:hypothetical protein EV356DRAFT_502652 [Viridothelium virens]|uniref:Uncharacterized protein n=1 Tax=Viridothelium virens TaxID=1048519 RepID=A0A6A6H7N4_VIRVR|nr:hypothetical protein EV356DRAFT_502652 [Viridothelium virens]
MPEQAPSPAFAFGSPTIPPPGDGPLSNLVKKVKEILSKPFDKAYKPPTKPLSSDFGPIW